MQAQELGCNYRRRLATQASASPLSPESSKPSDELSRMVIGTRNRIVATSRSILLRHSSVPSSTSVPTSRKLKSIRETRRTDSACVISLLVPELTTKKREVGPRSDSLKTSLKMTKLDMLLIANIAYSILPSRRRIDTIDEHDPELYNCLARYIRPVLIIAGTKIVVSKRIIAMYENSNSESDSNGLLLKIDGAKQEETLCPAVFPPSKFAAVDLIARLDSVMFSTAKGIDT